MGKYRPLLIGCGKQGVGEGQGEESNKIINFAHALSLHDGFDKICFVDKCNKKSAEAMEKYGGWATTIKYACEVLGADVAVVVTNDDQHYEILKQLAEYPLKLVLCEKPICADLDQAREIVELYKAKTIPLMVNYTRNFLPYYEDLKRMYEAGEFGKIVSANVVFNRGWKHTATHAISFLEWFFDSQYNGKIMECETDYRIWQIDLYFEKYHWREERIGDQPVWYYYDKSHWYVVENAYNFLEGKEPLKCTGEDALRSLGICYELMEGAKWNANTVNLEELYCAYRNLKLCPCVMNTLIMKPLIS